MLRFIGACDTFLKELDIIQKQVPHHFLLLEDILSLCDKPSNTFIRQYLEFGLASNCDNSYFKNPHNFLDMLQQKGVVNNVDVHLSLLNISLPRGSVKIRKFSKPLKIIKFDSTIFTEMTDPSFRYETKHFSLTLQEMNKLNIDWYTFSDLFPLLEKKDRIFLTNAIRMFSCGL